MLHNWHGQRNHREKLCGEISTWSHQHHTPQRKSPRRERTPTEPKQPLRSLRPLLRHLAKICVSMPDGQWLCSARERGSEGEGGR